MMFMDPVQIYKVQHQYVERCPDKIRWPNLHTCKQAGEVSRDRKQIS